MKNVQYLVDGRTGETQQMRVRVSYFSEERATVWTDEYDPCGRVFAIRLRLRAQSRVS